MSISTLNQTLLPVSNFLSDMASHPGYLKIQTTAFKAFRVLASSLAGLCGFVIGAIGGVILVAAGSMMGAAYLAVHLIKLYGICLKDGTSSFYSTSYDFIGTLAPTVKASA
jgi:hypothetical protein